MRSEDIIKLKSGHVLVYKRNDNATIIELVCVSSKQIVGLVGPYSGISSGIAAKNINYNLCRYIPNAQIEHVIDEQLGESYIIS